MSKPLQLSADEARLLALRAQGFLRPPNSVDGDVAAMLRRLGAVQLDTISVLARSHELVPYARLGSVGRRAVEVAYWGEPPAAFEYYAHAACVLPIEDWPYFAFRRRMSRQGRRRWTPPERILQEVRARLRDGPVTASDLGGARSGPGGWWSWSEAKLALEGIYLRGEAICTTRRNWKRVYDLPERVVPSHLLAHEPTDEECYAYLVRRAGRALGAGTRRDIANYYRLTVRWAGIVPDAARLLDAALDASGLVPATVEGWAEPAWVDPALLKPARREEHRTALLSPFDSLIWAEPTKTGGTLRERTYRIFGFRLPFEAYVPRDRRTHGYFSMPLLSEGRLVGHVDPARENGTLVARRVRLECESYVAAMSSALREVAAWVGCDAVRVDHVEPRRLAAPLRRALR